MMTDPEKWLWHSEVYAFRRIVLGAPVEQQTSPPDPDGKWFDEGLIRASAARLGENKTQASARRRAAIDADMGRAICNGWARDRGFADFAAAEAAGHLPREVVASIAAISAAKAMPAGPRGRWSGTAADLGVKAREYAPTPEQLRDGRVALGLEAPEPEAEAAA